MEGGEGGPSQKLENPTEVDRQSHERIWQERRAEMGLSKCKAALKDKCVGSGKHTPTSWTLMTWGLGSGSRQVKGRMPGLPLASHLLGTSGGFCWPAPLLAGDLSTGLPTYLDKELQSTLREISHQILQSMRGKGIPWGLIR